jgi:hypothetical protein
MGRTHQEGVKGSNRKILCGPGLLVKEDILAAAERMIAGRQDIDRPVCKSSFNLASLSDLILTCKTYPFLLSDRGIIPNPSWPANHLKNHIRDRQQLPDIFPQHCF